MYLHLTYSGTRTNPPPLPPPAPSKTGELGPELLAGGKKTWVIFLVLVVGGGGGGYFGALSSECGCGFG